jgi:hypothetical protein
VGTALGTLLMLALGLSLSYVFLVARDEPLGPGMPFYVDAGTLVHGEVFPQVDVQAIDYVDKEWFTVQLWVHNNGRFALTVTGVVPDPPYWSGLANMTDFRVGVIKGPAPCCLIDEQATWAAPDFRPSRLERDKEMPILVRFVIGHCEDSFVGGANSMASIRVNYDVLGGAHTTAIPLQRPITVRYTHSYECPRPPTRSGTPLTPPPTR